MRKLLLGLVLGLGVCVGSPAFAQKDAPADKETCFRNHTNCPHLRKSKSYRYFPKNFNWSAKTTPARSS